MYKKIIPLVIISLLIVSCKNNDKELKMLEQINSTIKMQTPIYELYPTRNMWNFIKLDTRNGKMWMVQYTIEDEDKRFETFLSMQSLVTDGDENSPGRFKLTPTDNIYNFILMDQKTGNTYQVQWSFEPEKRFVIPIR